MEQTQGLHLQQTLSPQMQQSLHILQVPLFELRQLTAQELLENPVLEEEAFSSTETEERTPTSEEETLFSASEPYYEQQRLSNPSDAMERHQYLMDSATRPVGMQEVLLGQIAFLDLPPQDARIAEAIAGNLEPSGYLGARIEEIAAPMQVTPLRVEEVLERLQLILEPPGMAARGLSECLLLQLRREGRDSGLEATLIKKFLPQVARRRFLEIAKSLGVSVESVKEAAAGIARLDPLPGREFEHSPEGIVVPEVLVERTEDGFSVRLNEVEIPRLRINNTYKDLLGQSGSRGKEVREYLREKLRGGRFFLRSIEQRNETILAIGKEIVARQKEFMESGPAFLKPMTMSTVAQVVGVHETTVSRAVGGKYMATPHGVFEMKYFFTSGYITESGEAVSNESVRQAILELVAEENPAKPLSDEAMVKSLSGMGLKVARRTIAKYRDQLNILPSHLRKR